MRWGEFQGDPQGPWTERDRAFAVALEQYERSLCPGCAYPIDEAWDPDEYDAHRAEPITCGRCRAIEKSQHDHNEKIRQGNQARDFGLRWTSHRRGETPMSQLLLERRQSKEGP